MQALAGHFLVKTGRVQRVLLPVSSRSFVQQMPDFIRHLPDFDLSTSKDIDHVRPIKTHCPTLPQPGYRPSEYCQVTEAIDSETPGSSTHFRRGDWEVVRVEQYAPIGIAEFDLIVVCYCRYAPVESPLISIRRGKGSLQLQRFSRCLAGENFLTPIDKPKARRSRDRPEAPPSVTKPPSAAKALGGKGSKER